MLIYNNKKQLITTKTTKNQQYKTKKHTHKEKKGREVINIIYNIIYKRKGLKE